MKSDFNGYNDESYSMEQSIKTDLNPLQASHNFKEQEILDNTGYSEFENVEESHKTR